MVKYLLKYLNMMIVDIAQCVLSMKDASGKGDRSSSSAFEEKINEMTSEIFKNSKLDLENIYSGSIEEIREKLRDRPLEMISIFQSIENRQADFDELMLTSIEEGIDFYKLLDRKDAVDDILPFRSSSKKLYIDKLFEMCTDGDKVKAEIEKNAEELNELFRGVSEEKVEKKIKSGYKSKTVESFTIMEFMLKNMPDILKGIDGEENRKYSIDLMREAVWNYDGDTADIIRILILGDNSRIGVFRRNEPADVEAVEKVVKTLYNYLMSSKEFANGYGSRKRINGVFTNGGIELGNKDICTLINALPDIRSEEREKILEEFDFKWKFEEFEDYNIKSR